MSKERAHSKFSASGAERWVECSASVEASEGQPDKDSPWSIEGTFAHSVLEQVMKDEGTQIYTHLRGAKVPLDMMRYALGAAEFILGLGRQLNSEVLVEQRIYLDFIHREMFGTFDGAVLDHFGTLHVFDYKYGAGHAVSPKENLQMIFYGLGLAHKYQWNFKTVRLWIIQPRIKGYDGPIFWDLSIEQLKSYVKVFTESVWRVENKPEFKEGSWCHWCKAKSVCPLKREAKTTKAIDLFKSVPITNNQGGQHGKKEIGKKAGKDESQKSKTKKENKSNATSDDDFGYRDGRVYEW